MNVEENSIALSNNNKLIMIKLIHTAIWSIMAIAILYILYAGVFNRVNPLVWYCISLILFEGMILLICKWKCPLTLIGYKYTDDRSIGFDIFLPAWLAKHNKTLFTVLFLTGLILVLWHVFI